MATSTLDGYARAEVPAPCPGTGSLLDRLHGVWHDAAFFSFMALMLAHWAEHIAQAVQVWVLGIPFVNAYGFLGWMHPGLVVHEWLHFGYAVLTMSGILVLRGGMAGRALRWWNMALAVQAWHLVEHTILFTQGVTGAFLFGAQEPVTLVQLLVPRLELHLAYNAAVTLPMLVAMRFHLLPAAGEAALQRCRCAARARLLHLTR